MDALDGIMEEMERDFEIVLRGTLDSQDKFEKPLYYGFSVQIDDDGHPVVQTYGNTGVNEEGTREPIYEEILDREKGQTRIVVELPGIEKEDLELNCTEDTAGIKASRGERRYSSTIALKEKVEPDTASAKYRNGVLDITFSLKGKDNKGQRKITIS
ncbi:MAG: Hsp20 family protein [Nitrososphaerales archaeon]